MMAKRSTIPFGPQHPVLPEPIHLDLVLEDEVVVEAIPNIGFVHRGLEKLVETRDFKQYVYVAERVCGICSFGHGLGYCQSIEQMMGIDVPRRARVPAHPVDGDEPRALPPSVAGPARRCPGL